MNPNDETPVQDFINAIQDPAKRQQTQNLVQLMQKATGVAPKMWGAIIGFGTHHYVYESGREGDTVAVGFAPRKTELVVYGVLHYMLNESEAANLGKCKFGKGCIYIKKLEDIDTALLSKMTAKAFAERCNA